MEFQGQVALVTGGSSGIGRAIAGQLAEAGARVILAARDRGKGEAARREITGRGGQVDFYSVDLSDAAAVQALVQTVDQAYGGLHILVNNAGGGDYELRSGSPEELMAHWERQANDNFLSAYLTSSLAMEVMRRSGGAIANISSTASLHGTYGLYSAMKTGVEGLTRALAFKYAPLGIRVNAVAPGWIRTVPPPYAGDPAVQEWEKTTSLLGRMGDPEEVAAAVLFLVSQKASFITGATLFVDGGLSINDPTYEGLDRAVQAARARAEPGRESG